MTFPRCPWWALEYPLEKLDHTPRGVEVIAVYKYNTPLESMNFYRGILIMSHDDTGWVRRLTFQDEDDMVLGWLAGLRSGSPAERLAAANSLLNSMQDGLTKIVQRQHDRERRLSSRFYGHEDIVQDINMRLLTAFESMAEAGPEKLPTSIEAYEGLVRFHMRCAFGDVYRKVFGKNKPGAHHKSVPNQAFQSGDAGLPEKQAAAKQPGPRTQLINEESWRQLPEAIASLPEGQREVCELRFFSGLSNSEIAWILGVSERTVRDRALKAMATMKSKLDKTDFA